MTTLKTEFALFERIAVNVADHVATIELAAAPVNAQDRRMREELVRAFDVLGASDAVGAIVLTGRGKTFSAGADLDERPKLAAEPGGYARHNRLVRAAFDAPIECPKPVIAAVNGAAIGAGAVLALCCDIMVVSEDAFLAMTEVDVGMAGGARHVLRSFSPSDARLVVLTARRISGADLYRMNVASILSTPDQLMGTAQGLAREIATKAPLAVIAAKRSFDFTEAMSMRDGYRYEQSQTAALALTEDTREAFKAFSEKRKPVFQGR